MLVQFGNTGNWMEKSALRKNKTRLYTETNLVVRGIFYSSYIAFRNQLDKYVALLLINIMLLQNFSNSLFNWTVCKIINKSL